LPIEGQLVTEPALNDRPPQLAAPTAPINKKPISLGKRALIALGALFVLCLIVAFVLVADARAEHLIDKMTVTWDYVIDWDKVHELFQIETKPVENAVAQPQSKPQPQPVAQPEPEYDPHARPLKFVFKHPDGCVTCEATDKQLQQYADALIPAMGFRPPKPDDSIVLVILIEHLPPTLTPAGQPHDDRYYECGESPVSRIKPYHCTWVQGSFGLQKADGKLQILTFHIGADAVTDQPYVPSVWVDDSNSSRLIGPGMFKPYSVAVDSWLTDYYSYIRRLQY
jgi:hypothetical protein